MSCHLCNAELKPDEGFRPELRVGEKCCAMCGQVIALIPQGPLIRTFNLQIGDLLGWPEKKVLETLGPPVSRNVGRSWPTEPGTDMYPYPITVNDEGRVQVMGRYYGPRQPKIAFPTPYEVWRYIMRDNSGPDKEAEWVLYLTGEASSRGKVTVNTEPPTTLQPSLWEKLTFQARTKRKEEQERRQVFKESLKPKGPLVVVDAYRIPRGVVF